MQAARATAAAPLITSRSERCGAEPFSAGTEDVGGADVAAADGADVLIAKKSDQQVSDGDGPEQIRGQDEQTDCQEHDQTEFSRKWRVEMRRSKRVGGLGRAACAKCAISAARWLEALVGGGAEERGNFGFEEAEIDGELSAMMGEMAEDGVGDHDAARVLRYWACRPS